MEKKNQKKQEFKILTKKQLENRLKDQGFSQYTMPGISRGEKRSGGRLLVRLNQYKNKDPKNVQYLQSRILINNEDLSQAERDEIYERQMNYGFTSSLNMLKNKENDQQKKIEQITKKEPKINKNEFEIKKNRLVLQSFKKKNRNFRINNKKIKKKQEDIEKSVETKKKSFKNNFVRKNQNELDTYIHMAINKSSEVDEFVYLINNPQTDDPYDLQIKSYLEIQENNPNQYYTISSKGLCQFERGHPKEFVSIDQWVKERQIFDQIKKLNFFRKFIKWKSMRQWFLSYKKFKKNFSIKKLQKNFIINNVHIRECLMNCRQELSKVSRFNLINLDFANNNQKQQVTMEEFQKIQEEKLEVVEDRVREISQECLDVYEISIKKRIEKLKNTTLSETESVIKFQQQINEVDPNNPYILLGFSLNMSYDKRSELRKECKLFMRLAHLVDIMSLSLLIGTYLQSMENFKTKIREKGNQKISMNFKNNTTDQSQQSIFKIQLLPVEDYENEDIQISQLKIEDFKRIQKDQDQITPADYSDYSLLAHPFVVDYDIIHGFNQQNKKYLEYQEGREVVKKELTNIQYVSSEINPSLIEFYEAIEEVFSQGFQTLDNFQSIFNSEYIEIFNNLIENHLKSPEQEDSMDELFLETQRYINKEQVENLQSEIHLILEDQFEKTKIFQDQFKKFLEIQWEYKHLDFGLLRNKNLAKTTFTIECILNLLTYHTQIFQKNIPVSSEVGIFHIDSEDVRDQLIKLPGEVRNEFIEQMKEETDLRIDQCQEWIKVQMENIIYESDDIETLTQQIDIYQEINGCLEYYKELIKTSSEIVEIFQIFSIEISEETKKEIQQTQKQMVTLNDLKNQVFGEIQKNQKIFKDQILKEEIPKIQQEIAILEKKIKNDDTMNQEIQDAQEYLQRLKFQMQDLIDKVENFKEFLLKIEEKEIKIKKTDELTKIINAKLLLLERCSYFRKLMGEISEVNLESFKKEQWEEEIEKEQKTIIQVRKLVSVNLLKYQEYVGNVKKLEELLPFISALKNQKFKKVNIKQIESVIQRNLSIKKIKIGDLLDDQIFERREKVVEISVQVNQEHQLKIKLEEVEEKIQELTFPLVSYKEDSPKDQTYILGNVEDLISDVDWLILHINQIYGSRYLLEYKKQAHEKRNEILTIQAMLQEWIDFQKNYIYLQSILSQPEMKKPLVVEIKEFEDSVNKQYKSNMKKIVSIQYISQLIKQKYLDQFFKHFKQFNIVLQSLNNKINDFLDQKRQLFPRFYFVSNEELIFILANSDQPSKIQLFVSQLFENIDFLDFGENPKSFNFDKIISREKEIFKLKASINVKSQQVDKWLKRLEDQIQESLFRNIKESLMDYVGVSRKQWYLSTISQVCYVISQYAFTVSVEASLNHSERQDELQQNLNDNQENINTLIELIQDELEGAKRKQIVSIITSEIHNRDIIQELIEQEVDSVEHFIWEQQLKFYFNDSLGRKQALQIKQMQTLHEYGYEYYGPCSRIVITPLTERCWITISSALNMKLGTAPQGPAGTGKTESTKDLAKSLGRFCLVYNCSDQVNYQMMDKMFRGVIQQETWVCLDEFNRIQIEVLSVVAQQLSELRHAQLTLNSGDQFFFCGSKCTLMQNCAIFITMNPTYKGRTALPENLKSLFRPISMMIPDYQLISRILLYAQGFKNSEYLSEKIIKLFSISSEQLSYQTQYDFGLRAIKALLNRAGDIKRKEKEQKEEDIVIQALQTSILPRLVQQDIQKFKLLLRDFFPSLQQGENEESSLKVKIKQSMVDRDYRINEKFLNKAEQLNLIINSNTGTILIGKAMTGKSSLLEVLDGCQEEVELVRFNPKAMKVDKLFGYNNQQNDWKEGIISELINQGINTQKQFWIVFDGPADTSWIENMNSVLDDSKILCLPNGQRIRIPSNIKMIFEIETLANVSPATVSRCGVVFLSPQLIKWEDFYQRWKSQQSKLEGEYLEKIEELMNDHFCHLLDYFMGMTKNSQILIPQQILTFLDILEYFLKFLPKKENQDFKNEYLEIAFIYSIAWGFAGGLEQNKQEKLDNQIKKRFPNVSFPADIINNCLFNTKKPSLEMIVLNKAKKIFSPSQKLSEIFIPTLDTIKLTFISEIFITRKQNLMLLGNASSGKTCLAQHLQAKHFTVSSLDTLKVNINKKSTPQQIQEDLMDNLFLLSQKSRGAKFGRYNMIFLDDVHLAPVKEYNAVPSIELLRFFLDQKIMYNMEDYTQITIKDTFCMGIGRMEQTQRKLNKRFLRHFACFRVPVPNKHIKIEIYSKLLKGFMSNYSQDITGKIDDLINCGIEVFESLQSKFLPITKQPHYIFSLRDLSRVFENFLIDSEFEDCSEMIKIWIYEMNRVFYDKLIDEKDRDEYRRIYNDQLERNLQFRYSEGTINQIYVSKLASTDKSTKRQFKNQEHLHQQIQEIIQSMNLTLSTPQELIVFDDFIENFLKIDHILNQKFGNLILVGLGGIGKKTLTQLSCFNNQITFIELDPTVQCDQEDYVQWLKDQVISKCLNGKQICLYIKASFLQNKNIIQHLLNMIRKKELGDLYDKDQKQKLIELTKSKRILKVKKISWSNVVNFVLDQFHLVIDFSPKGNRFYSWIREFPMLLDIFQFKWLDEWNEETLVEMSKKTLEENDEQNTQILLKINAIHSICQEVGYQYSQELQTTYYANSQTCQDLMKLYKNIYQLKREESQSKIDQFRQGSQKLIEMSQIVEKLQTTIKNSQPILEKQKIIIAQKIKEVTVSEDIAQKRKKEVDIKAEEISKEKSEIEKINKMAQEELEKAIPLIQATEYQVRNIDRKQLNTLRTLGNPPAMIEHIFQTVCFALGKKYEGWKQTGRKMLTDLTKFIYLLIKQLEKIKLKGASVISSSNMAKIKENLQSKFFNAERLNTNVIAKPLAKWCLAIVDYVELKKKVKPLEDKVQKLKKRLEKTEAEYNVILEEQEKCQLQYKKINDELQQTEKQFNKIKEDIHQSKIKLERAFILTDLLSEEGERWKKMEGQLRQEMASLKMLCFFQAFKITYLSPLTKTFRMKIIEQINEIWEEQKEAMENQQIMADIKQLTQWKSNGLSEDSVTINSIVATYYSEKCPFLIDPQGQALKYFQSLQQSTRIKILEQKNFNSKIHRLEDLQNEFDFVVIKNIKNEVSIGIKEIIKKVQQSPLKVILISILDSPQISPDIYQMCQVVNFVVTQQGLTDQILVRIMQVENPTAEKILNENTQKIANFRLEIDQLQSKTLNLLVSCQESPVNDDSLVKTLQNSQKIYSKIKINLKEINETQEKLEKLREKYQPLSVICSRVYFIVKSLSRLNQMYQSSLISFINTIIKAINNTSEIENRVEILQKNILINIYQSFSLGLLNQDKILFSLLIASAVMIFKNQIKPKEWSIFCQQTYEIKKIKKISEIFSEEENQKISYLIAKIPELGVKLLKLSEEELQNFVTDKNQLEFKFANLKINSFHKLILSKLINPKNLLLNVRSFIRQEFEGYFDNQNLSIEQISQLGQPRSPIVFIISSQSNITENLMNFAEKQQQHFVRVSLGQGQTERAEKLIKESQQEGYWILLENLHLAKSWLLNLENIIGDLQNIEKIHQNFKLFMTSVPADYFPSRILKLSIKITTEPPKGIKAKLSKVTMLYDFNQNLSCPLEYEIKKLNFCLSLFHCIVQERCNYKRIGWNNSYSFNDSDLIASQQITESYLKKIPQQQSIPWDQLKFLVGKITYCGRIIDDNDTRLLITLLSQCFNFKSIHNQFKIGSYSIPQVINKDQIKNFISTFQNNSPEIMGLHVNTQIMQELSLSQEFIQKLQKINSIFSKSEKDSKKFLGEIWEKFTGKNLKIEKLIDKEKGHSSLYQKDSNPLTNVLFAEIDTFNNKSQLICKYLKELRDAFEGRIALNEYHLSLYQTLETNQVPEQWQSKDYLTSLCLTKWIECLGKTKQFLEDWLKRGSLKKYWIQGLDKPSRFLTCILQHQSRLDNQSVDQYKFSFKVMSEKEEEIQEVTSGALIDGLYLECATWDSKKKILTDAQPNELIKKMPLIHFIPCIKSKSKRTTYSCPFYRNSKRKGLLSSTGQSTNFIINIDLPCDKNPQFWIMRSVALFCEKN